MVLRAIVRRTDLWELSMIVRYAIVGLANTIVAFLTYAGLVTFAQMPYWVANSVGIGVSVLCGYFLSRTFVFKNTARSIRSSGWRYFTTFIIQYVVGTAMIGALIALSLSEVTAYIFALPLMIAVSFVLQRYWVFAAIK